MVTIFTLTYNEELLIQFMIDHYRSRFPGCRIVIHDNLSTDNTVKIATANNCEVIPFNTANQYREDLQVELRNNCWKDSLTDWVLVCDLDELLDINQLELKEEQKKATTIIKTETYDMISLTDNLEISEIKYGVKSPLPGKLCLFNKKLIKEMNYGPGSHSCNPEGQVNISQKIYKLYHYNSVSLDTTIKKFKERSERMSTENLQNGWGFHYLMTPEEIREEYKEERAKAIKVRD
jgi:glycosyltransferase involved in cell wall biosynthesis